MTIDIAQARHALQANGQEHLLRHWDTLGEEERTALLSQIESIDFALMNRLIDAWIRQTPEAERFDEIKPVPVIPPADPARPDAREALEAGEQALRDGRAGLLLVAGGQGTRLGFDGPKGAYPVGPVTGRTLFEFHADKIRNLQRRYGCVLPWYIMVSNTNAAATESFFQAHDYFGLGAQNVRFFQQRMVPCVAEDGKFMLDAPHHIAMNPNGHGGVIPATVDTGVTADARARGIDVLSYFQVDNWAVKVADPYFIGYHVLRNAQMSSKNHRKNDPREAVGVHCICDGEYRVIEYTELDIYPQLLETDEDGNVVYCAGNPAIHAISVEFIEDVCRDYGKFPWHCSHKKIPHLNEHGDLVEPKAPNGYKFETFVFDALRFIDHEPVALLIERAGEYTPIKSFEGSNSVVAARESQRNYWGGWLAAAGCEVPSDSDGNVTVDLEISPDYALTREEFMARSDGRSWPCEQPMAILPDGSVKTT